MDNVGDYCKRLGQLKGIRAEYEPHWADCYRFGCPERIQSFADSSQASISSVQRNARADLYDSTAAEGIQLLVASTMSATTPPNSIWFQPVLDGAQDGDAAEDDGEKWLQTAAKTVWRNIHAANFDSEALDAVTDAVVAGWMVMYIDVDRKIGGFVFETWPISNCYIASTRIDGLVDTIYREYELTAAQIAKEYPDTASQKVKTMVASTPDAKIKVIHVIEPRDGKGRYLAKSLPFASYIIEVDSKTMLLESGYHEFPCAVARWKRIPNSVYANGQMSIALPDAKTVNKLVETTLQSAELAIGGMWIAEDDGVLNPATIRVGPRRVIAANSVDSMKPLTTGAQFQVSELLLAKFQGGIRKKLLSDQLQPADGPAMTATEVHVRVDLIRQQLGPIYGRQQSEYLHPLLDRCFGLAFRAGVLGQPPQSLAGRSITYKYLSPLARAQSLEEVTSIERLLQDLDVLQQLNPNAADNVDFDACLQIIGQGLGVPPAALRTADARDKLRAARVQAQLEQAQQQQAMALQQHAGQKIIDTAAAQAQQQGAA